jgi:hypothetical protein
MTLIVALMAPAQAILVSDRRLTKNGQLVDDEKNKATVLVCADGRVAVAFTGLAVAVNSKLHEHYCASWRKLRSRTICCSPRSNGSQLQ